jgi:hypothetical protein
MASQSCFSVNLSCDRKVTRFASGDFWNDKHHAVVYKTNALFVQKARASAMVSSMNILQFMPAVVLLLLMIDCESALMRWSGLMALMHFSIP